MARLSCVRALAGSFALKQQMQPAWSHFEPGFLSSPSHSLVSAMFSSKAPDGSNRGRTAGELGDDMAQSMSGAEGKAAGSGGNVEEK